MGNSDLQAFFFQCIREKIPSHQSFVDDISELLNISNDSAYRRIRGEKQMTFDEITLLAKRYQISLDQIVNADGNSFLFNGNLIHNKDFRFETYLNDMMNNVILIASIPDHHFYFDAKDIPPFHYFMFPELSAFKLYFWMKNILVDPRFEKIKFEHNEILDGLIPTGLKIAEAYKSIRSTEIWVEETINSTIRQIDYCYDAGYFQSTNDCKKVYGELIELLDHIEDQASYGEKFLPGRPASGTDNFKFYINDILLGHNTSFVSSSKKKIAFVNYSNINFMSTFHAEFCDHIESAFEVLISKSNQISKVNERERRKFFNTLRAFVESQISKLS